MDVRILPFRVPFVAPLPLAGQTYTVREGVVIDAGIGDEMARVHRLHAGDGELIEDRAAAVVDDHDRGRDAAEAAGGGEGADVVNEGDVADEAGGGAGRDGGDAEGRRDDAVDAVEATVSEDPQRFAPR